MEHEFFALLQTEVTIDLTTPTVCMYVCLQEIYLKPEECVSL